ncbi:hypothetical protein K432DRAFT_211221 [Lepidopterella palustris CBS 459.81]|uniref:Uncharacterized protein n=1 Tax=Lepidopterella palustris CBS 459.81 TaxID=1314670 RepID=A0A8E2JHF0_9PEZI|nr:hypothetical protein K432DRAFT_211221 [Lepidopterella palustris CBS 459.81]
MFTKKTACRQHHVDSCAPTLQESRQAVSGGSYYYTACINWGLDSGHSSRAVPDTLYPQIRHLQNMFGDVDEREIKNEFCTVLKPLNSRQVHCGVDHERGQGRMNIIPCAVQFNQFIPTDLSSTPYIIWVSHGQHMHPPPPPTKPPDQYLTEIMGGYPAN